MRIRRRDGIVMVLNASPESAPALREIARQSPHLRIQTASEDGRRQFICEICEFDFGHFTLQMLNAERGQS